MVLVTEVALAGEVIVAVIVGIIIVAVGERKKVVIAVVTVVMAILHLQHFGFWGCIDLLYLQEFFLFLCMVAVNLCF